MNIKTSQATKSNRRDAGKYKNYSLALQNTITVESDYFVRSIWMSHFLVRFFLFDFFLQLFCPIYLNADFFLRYFCLIYLSDFFVLFFLFAFSSDFLSLECTIFYPIWCECSIFSPNFLSNFLSKLFECSLFSSDFFVRFFVRFNGANYSTSMSSFSLSKIDGQTQLIKSKLFIPCLACANFVMVILLLATFWCSVTMFTKLQFLISNFATAGVLSLSITVASHQRRILSIKQDIMVFHCMKTKIL